MVACFQFIHKLFKEQPNKLMIMALDVVDVFFNGQFYFDNYNNAIYSTYVKVYKLTTCGQLSYFTFSYIENEKMRIGQ